MNIKFDFPPPESVNAFIDGVRQFLTEVDLDLTKALQIAALAPTDHLPHQIYFIRLDDVAAGKELDAATFTGWRYVLSLSEGELHAVETDYDAASNQHSFASVNQGPFPDATIDLLRSQESLAQIGEEDFVFAMIRIPALYVFAAWFKNEGQNTNILIPLAPTHHSLEAGKSYTPEQFFGLLKPEAESLLEVDFDELYSDEEHSVDELYSDDGHSDDGP